MSYTQYNYNLENLSPCQKTFRFVWDLLKVVIISLVIIIPVRYFLIQPFYVKGASMEPNFFDNEYLIINEIDYGIKVPFTEGGLIPLEDPKRGEIVVFRYPRDPSQFFIKRIIGLPGETVEIKDNVIYITDVSGRRFMLDETSYLSTDKKTQGSKAWTLAEDEFYVLGDNRDFSLDSRSFGPVHRDLLIGKVWLRGWPLNRWKYFGQVRYE